MGRKTRNRITKHNGGGFILQRCFQDKYGLLYRLIQWKPEMSSETRNRITNFFLTVTNKILKFK